MKNISIMLNENLFDIEECNDREFDEFVRIFLPIFKEGKKKAKTICLPIKYHKHSLKFKDWTRKKSVQLQRIDGKYFLNFIYEKEDAKKKDNKKKIGIDLGYHKLIADSDGNFYGQELNTTTFNMARMNMILHGVKYNDFDIRQGDTLEEP